jgi:hypothetical protein
MASKVSGKGQVSALCSARAKAIDLKKATWTLFAPSVTCPKCVMKLKELNNA